MNLHGCFSRSSTAAEKSLEKVFNGTELLAAYRLATDAVLEFCEQAKTLLREARDDGRIIEEALRGFSKDGSVSNLVKSLHKLRSSDGSFFSDKSFMEDFTRKGSECWKQISNLERMTHSTSFSIWSRLSSLLSAFFFHPKRIPALHRHYAMLNSMSGDAVSLMFYSKMIAAFVPLIGTTKSWISIRIAFGQVEKLEGDLEHLKLKIETLQEWTLWRMVVLRWRSATLTWSFFRHCGK